MLINKVQGGGATADYTEGMQWPSL